MEQISITLVTIADVAVIQHVAKATFFETFSGNNTEADMKHYLDLNFSEEKLGSELNHPDSLFFVARDGDDAVGYLKLNTGDAQTEKLGDTAMEIERIYVKSSHHGKKVGQLLYQQALQLAEQQHKSFLWLGVWEENPRAIRFYEKNGFVPFATHPFQFGEETQTDILMKKILKG